MGVSSSKPHDKATKWFPEFEQKLPSLEGKTVCITGCTTGTGYVVARTAVRKGASTVLLLNRPSDRATAAEQSLKDESTTTATTTVIETIACDLQDFESVRAAASSIKSKYSSIDVLCNNAGVMALEDEATGDGYDIQMQTNHLSHFLLTKELYPLLQKAAAAGSEARVCNHSSLARVGKPLERDYFGKNGGNLGGNGNSMIGGGARWQRYQQSKLANSVFSLALSERFEKSSSSPGLVLKSVCAHPGIATTNLQVTTAQRNGMGNGMWIMRFAQSAEDGSMPMVAACFDPSSENGSFWAPSKNGQTIGPVKKIDFEKDSKNEDSKTMLWEVSEEACGVFNIL